MEATFILLSAIFGALAAILGPLEFAGADTAAVMAGSMAGASALGTTLLVATSSSQGPTDGEK